MKKWALVRLLWAKNYTLEHMDTVKEFASFNSSHLSLVREDGALDLYHGNLRAIDASGNIIFDQVDYKKFNGLHHGRGTVLVIQQIPLYKEPRTY